MATGGSFRELSEELACPICLEYFKDPMILTECCHNFCRACLTRSWQESGAIASCPVCKHTAEPTNLRPNRQLANVVEITRKLSFQRKERVKEETRERICEKHRKPLNLFCQTDGILICKTCDRSKKHKNHEAIPVEEAAQGYKDKIFSCLESLRIEREKILKYLADAKDENQEMLKITKSEKQKTVAEFRRLHQLLEEQENRLLAQIEEVENEIARKRDEHLAKLSEELSSLKSLIREMEEKHQQPVSELLQDVRSSLQRCKEKENFKNPVVFSSDLKWRLQGCCDISPFLGGVMKQFKDTLVSELQMQKESVTLDPTTASHKLIVSEDRRSIKLRSEDRDLPEVPDETIYAFVLGCEGFTAGCHFWQVSVGSEEGWAVGVARKSMKGRVTFIPEKGIWAVGRSKGRYKAFIKGTDPSPLTLQGELNRIRVCLNYAGGRVAFFDADQVALLYEFSGASFSGEILCPFFAVKNKGYLTLCPLDSQSSLTGSGDVAHECKMTKF
ncbi:zinc finger protein RFP-like [Heteronotia binoei]|uniref:zinc finger protein RFP-like n=1 Tax=Heteronotia binoei TaxID=13085 RepID=UPI002930B10D|nr:zinc finger protein RFP-like [Heteronotia binoei]